MGRIIRTDYVVRPFAAFWQHKIKNTRSSRVFIRQAAEANMHIAKAQNTSQIPVFIDDVKHSLIVGQRR